MESLRKQLQEVQQEIVLDFEDKILSDKTSLAELQVLKKNLIQKYEDLERDKRDVAHLIRLCNKQIKDWGTVSEKRYRII